jgi:adenosylmethionine-8-amino-7-oxononanoate aminotransferase
LVERVAELAPPFAATFGELTGVDAVAEVRTAGLLAAVQLSDAALEDPGFGDRTIAELQRGGVLTRMIAGGAIQVSPPYITRQQELTWARDVIAQAVEAAARG